MDEGIKPTEEVKPIKDSLGERSTFQSECECSGCSNCSGCTSNRGGNYDCKECDEYNNNCGGDQN